MDVIIEADEAACGVTVADVFARAVRGGASTLGLATGSSPLSVYQELIRRHRDEGLNFVAVQAFLLDEYMGLPVGRPQSYAQVIRTEFTDHVDIGRVLGPDGFAADVEAAEVPRCVITQGLGTISTARHLVLIATGAHKSAAVAAALEGPVTSDCPASVLQLHARVTVVVDEAAGARLRIADL